MPQHYATIAFTDDVQQAQQRFGSRESMRRFAAADVGNDVLTAAEREFVEQSDGFHVATTGSGGWPYVQHRGGPPGFLRVLDDHTLGYADFRGNRQYITTGNLAGNDKASLFLMDHALQRRLKIYGRLEVIAADERPDLRELLTPPDYPARVERLVLVHVAAYDWNCPQHITPRFTHAQIEAALVPLRKELEALRAENAALRASHAPREEV
ncbi:pyridoxamine 5'-phosphate oxidase family protein [Pseudonocardia nigra]|uniref:pyridoxamine 5'-phosphate oxidase family protein n=1 Tax=Pseudonocardia nigra TaxID=1921578 RepID=UPI001C5D44B6|nr:pyridoxamine 5'-phosphate oxidase family protein [Pseudonocardia nigra]